jgi:predicted HAD superfamily Cof-like phosphohydrolase
MSTNIWAQQLHIMRLSGQATPERPQTNKTGLLYALLIMEELGEYLQALAAVYQRAPVTGASAELLWRLDIQGRTLIHLSAELRVQLASTPDTVDVPPNNAFVGVLDGLTDLAVVVAGAGLALGLPAEEAYIEVYRSNTSKVNPDTGVIDKTPDGKWVKGRGFFPPDLDAVLNLCPPARSSG